MGKLTKPDKIKVSVFLDTNFLFTTNKRDYFSRFFFSLLQSHVDTIDLEIVFPEVTLEEIKYQVFKEASQSLASLKKSSKYLNDLLDLECDLKDHTEAKLLELISKKYSSLQAKHNITVIPTPFAKINLSEIQEMSLRREGVFSPIRASVDGVEQEVGEKGFRDYLILKTVESALEDRKADPVNSKRNVFILTRDVLLLRALQDCVNELKIDAVLFDDQKKFQNHIAGIANDIELDWLNGILPIASQLFFDKDAKQGLWFDLVKAELSKKYQREIDDLSPNGLLISKSSVFDSSVYSIGKARFLSRGGDSYTWVTEVKLEKKFKSESTWLSVYSAYHQSPAKEPTRLESAYLNFEVKWTSKVNNEAVFDELTLVDISVVKNESSLSTFGWLNSFA